MSCSKSFQMIKTFLKYLITLDTSTVNLFLLSCESFLAFKWMQDWFDEAT